MLELFRENIVNLFFGRNSEIKKTSNPGTELIKVFSLLDKSSTPRSKGAVICMKPGLSAIDRDNYIVPIWMI